MSDSSNMDKIRLAIKICDEINNGINALGLFMVSNAPDDKPMAVATKEWVANFQIQFSSIKNILQNELNQRKDPLLASIMNSVKWYWSRQKDIIKWNESQIWQDPE